MTIYKYECSLPDLEESSTTHFVKSSDVRGTLEIVWPCLTTLVVCVYKVLKPNLPDPRDKHRHPSAMRTLKAVGLAIMILLAPEVVVLESIFELLDAHRTRKMLAKAAGNDKQSWSLTQAFYVNMGGYVIRCPSGELWPLDGATLATLIEDAYVRSMPPLTDDEIKDKSKDSTFSKTIALVQILYFYIGFFSRVAWNSPLSQLELAVAGIALYSLVSYVLGWSKPKDIRTPTTLNLSQ